MTNETNLPSRGGLPTRQQKEVSALAAETEAPAVDTDQLTKVQDLLGKFATSDDTETPPPAE